MPEIFTAAKDQEPPLGNGSEQLSVRGQRGPYTQADGRQPQDKLSDERIPELLARLQAWSVRRYWSVGRQCLICRGILNIADHATLLQCTTVSPSLQGSLQ